MLRENRAAFTRIKLRPLMLVGVGHIELATTALGTPISMPIMVPPLAFLGMAHSQGEAAIARGVGEAGMLMVVGTPANRSLEKACAD